MLSFSRKGLIKKREISLSSNIPFHDLIASGQLEKVDLQLLKGLPILVSREQIDSRIELAFLKFPLLFFYVKGSMIGRYHSFLKVSHVLILSEGINQRRRRIPCINRSLVMVHQEGIYWGKRHHPFIKGFYVVFQ